MVIIKKDTSIPGYHWLVWDTKQKSGDLVSDFSDAIRMWFWRMGVPPRIAFYSYKVFARRKI